MKLRSIVKLVCLLIMLYLVAMIAFVIKSDLLENDVVRMTNATGSWEMLFPRCKYTA